jgi:hypothetical protein
VEQMVLYGEDVGQMVLCGEDVGQMVLCGEDVEQMVLCGEDVKQMVLCGEDGSIKIYGCLSLCRIYVYIFISKRHMLLLHVSFVNLSLTCSVLW